LVELVAVAVVAAKVVEVSRLEHASLAESVALRKWLSLLPVREL